MIEEIKTIILIKSVVNKSRALLKLNFSVLSNDIREGVISSNA